MLAAPAAQLMLCHVVLSFRHYTYSYDFFRGCPCPILVLYPGGAPRLPFSGTIPRMHVFARVHLLCLHMYKEGSFPFGNLGQMFASCSVKLIPYALVCPFLQLTYQQHFSIAAHFTASNLLSAYFFKVLPSIPYRPYNH